MPAPSPAESLLPTGTVTFLFTDIEGSTLLWKQDSDRMSAALATHDAVARVSVENNHGVVVRMTGDGIWAAFADPADALKSALALQRALADPTITAGVSLRVRCGLHAGAVERRDNDYFGPPVNRAARIMAAAYGGQVLLSQVVADCVRENLPATVSLRDMGTVRLKDLATPEHVYQVSHPDLRQEFPALRSLEAIPNNLPQQVTSFIGRERELSQVRTLLGKNRLLTLLGMGGLGKTRLSMHVGAEVLDEYPDGVWFVELAPLADARLAPQAVASVLGVKEDAGRSVREALLKFVADRHLLLILDNCEHLGRTCAALASDWLQAGPKVKILATSREPLHVPGEAIYPLPTLSVPDPQNRLPIPALMQYEAVHLFIDRAVAAHKAFHLTDRNAIAVADICHRLDGIPLAIELAAARTRALAVDEIDARLSDRFRLLTGGYRTALPRQQTLRACIDWSYDLLHDPEKLLLQRLSVFVGGWTLAAAEAVGAGGEVDAGDVLDHLTQLVEKSLVEFEADDPRYRLLQTVRQYAQEALNETVDGDMARSRHLAFFMALAEEAEPKLMGAEQAEWLQRLEAEHENLRAGLEWSLVGAGPESGLRLCGSLQRFWFVRGHYSEGREWCARILAISGAEARTPERAKALNGAGVLAHYQADYAAARARHEESLAIRRHLNDRIGMASSLGNLANLASDQGDLTSAQTLHEESLAIAQELGDRHCMARALHNLGLVASRQGDATAAWTQCQSALAIMRELGDRTGIASALHNLAGMAFRQRDYPGARALYQEGLAMRRNLGDRRGIADSLNTLANMACEQGDYRTAEALHHECLLIRRELGNSERTAYSLEGMAELAAALGGALRAARIWGAAERLREDSGSPLMPSERPSQDRSVAAIRAAVGDVAFDRAWQEGHALTLEQAIELALEKAAGHS